MGFDAIWVHDAPLGRRTTAAYDPIAVLSYIGGATKRIALATGILMPHVRNPVILAQQWATLFSASGGRAIMGVGTGAGTGTLLKREYEALAALRHDSTLDPQRIYAVRGRFFAETMDVVRRLWSEDKFSYRGEFYTFDEVTLGQARPPVAPPVLMGAGIYYPLKPGAPVHHGWQEKFAGKFVFGPYKRIVDHADGWLGLHLSPQQYEEKWARVQAYADEKAPGKSLHQGVQLLCQCRRGPRRCARWREAAPCRLSWAAGVGRPCRALGGCRTARRGCRCFAGLHRYRGHGLPTRDWLARPIRSNETYR